MARRTIYNLAWNANSGRMEATTDNDLLIPNMVQAYGESDDDGRLEVLSAGPGSFATMYLLDQFWLTVNEAGVYVLQIPANSIADGRDQFATLFTFYMEANVPQSFTFERDFPFRGNDPEDDEGTNGVESGLYLFGPTTTWSAMAGSWFLRIVPRAVYDANLAE
jgi:hypothetical protein